MADFIGIHYPNGSVEGVQVFIWDGTKPVLWDGAISVSTSGGPIQDGANATIKATVLALTDSKPLTVAIVDANGDQIASFGGGTQYTDAAATVAHPVGTMPVYDNAGTISKVGMSNGLPVQIRATNVTQPISAVSLPLPSGASTEATLALIKAKTDNIDVALSTRTKPADQQHVIVDSSALPTLAATSTKQSDGTQKSQVVDGSGNVISSTANALDVNLKSGGSTTVTEAATITANQASSALTAAVLFGFDGTTDSRVAAKNATPASNAVGIVTRPLSATDGTNTMPTMDAMARAGFQKTIPWADGTLKSGVTSAMTGTTSTSVIAGTASNYLYITSISVNNSHASVDTLVNLQDGSGGTVIWTLTAPHNYGGESHTFATPLKVPTIGNGLFAVDVTTGASVIISAAGFISTTSY